MRSAKSTTSIRAGASVPGGASDAGNGANVAKVATAPPGDSVLGRVTALETTPTADLKAMWRDLFQNDPPGFNRQFLISRLAYRIQELAYGGLSAATLERLEALAEDGRYVGAAAKKPIKDRPIAGTRLIREWAGVEHTVTVRDDGFEWQGRPFKSLSAVARAITGTRWNGPMFFGVRRVVQRSGAHSNGKSAVR